MAYTPELSAKESGMLRRIAWALGRPMTKTMNIIFQRLPEIYDRQMVCAACRDKSKCLSCGFSDEATNNLELEPEMHVAETGEDWDDFEDIIENDIVNCS